MADGKVIVFPTDFSDISLAALPWARRMAALEDAEVHCVYVVEEPQIYATLDMGPVPIPSAEELSATAKERLETFVREHVSSTAGIGGARAKTAVLVGRPADEIVRYAKETRASLIIMTTHGYSGVKHMLLGSTTEGVLRHATCPVLSIRNS